jgi:hypothetical protein
MAESYRITPILTPQEVERFLDKLAPIPETGCFIYTGVANKDGYGIVTLTREGQKAQWRAHRIAYVMWKGEQPGDLLVCHKCDIRLCCSPNHLFLGSHDDNQKDMAAKGRAAKGERHSSRTHPERVPKGERHHAYGSNPRVQGERHGKAKLTANIVRQLRKVFPLIRNYAELGRKFGISERQARRIIRRERWKHI